MSTTGKRKQTRVPLGIPYVRDVVALAAVYVVAAKFGIEQDVAQGVITPVWAPSGIAIAALVLGGSRLWPAIALGAFVANATSDVALWVAAVIAVGNTLEALTAEYLLGRVDFKPAIDRLRDVLALVVLAAIVATAVSATVGVSALTIAGEAPGRSFGEDWLLWWFGDLIGTLLVAPVILVWFTKLRRKELPTGRHLEAAGLTILLVVMSLLIFVGGDWEYPYLIFPLLVWAALRFEQLGATTAVLLVGGIATLATVDGSVPIGGASPTQAVQILQALIAVVAVGTFVIAATIHEREAAVEERARALYDLRERNEMYEMLLNAVSDLGEGFVVGENGRCVFANAAFCEMTGYTLEELLELPSLFEILPVENREEAGERLSHRLAGEAVQDHYETSLMRKDGQTIECEIAVKLVRTETGPRVISLMRDISERRQMESFQQNFLAYAAHELRSPVSVIAGYAHLLEQAHSLGSDQMPEIIKSLITNAEMMKARLETVMRLTRLDQGGAPLHPEALELEEVVSTLVQDMPPPDGKNLDVEVDAGTRAYVDKSAVQQIVSNLLTNAYRYGGDNVRLACHGSGGDTLIEVSDDGAGVPPDLVHRMFEPFVRDGSRPRSEGAGLGLSVVRALARASRGDVEYLSEGSGARFRVRLPSG